MHKTLALLVLIVSLTSAWLPTAVHGSDVAEATSPASTVHLLSSTDSEIVLEANIDWDDLDIETVTLEGEQYARLTVTGLSTTQQQGAPALPMVSATIGVPFGVSVGLDVSAGEVRHVGLPVAIEPVPTVEARWGPDGGPGGVLPEDLDLPRPERVVADDSEYYGSGNLYPGHLATIVSDGVIRQQRVVSIAAYPIQYDPQIGQIAVYQNLVIRIGFGSELSGGSAASWAEPDSEASEGILHNALLNYESAQKWRQRSGPSRGQLTNAWMPPDPGYKLLVREEGFYELSYGYLEAAGLPVATLDPRGFQVFHQGSEVAVYVPGEEDGSFDSTDSLLFYGLAPDSKYTAESVYWLTYGPESGQRMASRGGTPAGDAADWHDALLHFEQNHWYFSNLEGDEDLERFYWGYTYPPYISDWSHTFTLPALPAGEHTATLTVKMFGGLSRDHHTEVFVNGDSVAYESWNGLQWHTTTAPVPQSLLAPGNNTIVVRGYDDPANPTDYDIVYIDWADLQYASTFSAVEDSLQFVYEVASTAKYEVSGFTVDDIVVFDVTVPGDVERIVDATVTQDGSLYTLAFSEVNAGTWRYWATATTEYLTPAGIELDSPSNLQSTANGADYVIITHPEFADEVAPLATYRASKGLRVLQADVRDVYDEFGYGEVSAYAIRDFLAFAYQNWQTPAPTYVLLVGDGHYDPKGYLGTGVTSYIPPYLVPVDPWIHETASDNRYVSLTEGDNFPDMIIGRLPVNSSAETTLMVDRILAYEQSPEPGAWKEDVLFVADDADGAGNFAQLSDGVIDCCIPEPYEEEKVYYRVTHLTPADAKADIIAGINDGKLIVNFIGHASTTAWTGDSLLSVADVASLNNGGRLPMMLPMTCYDGYFHQPYPSLSGLGETIVRADGGGAIASWSPTGLGVATGHDLLNRGFLDAVLVDGVRVIGDATMAGKQRLLDSGTNLDLLDTYILFGDPALELQAPAPTAVVLSSFSAEDGPGLHVTLRWQTRSEQSNTGFNLYRSEEDGALVRLNDALIPTQVPPGSPYGSDYRFVDRDVQPATTYYYWLETVSVTDSRVRYGPVSGAAVDILLYLPLIAQ